MVTFISRELALAIHDRQLAEHGGSGGLRDDGLLQSALARPQQTWAYGGPEVDLAELAASLAYGLARNHPFVDGNKRTAFVCCLTFLALNGAELTASREDRFLRFLAMAEGSLTLEDFTAWLRAHVRGDTPPAAQEMTAATARA